MQWDNEVIQKYLVDFFVGN